MAVDHHQQDELLLRFARIVAADGYARGLQPVQWQALVYLDAANRFSRTPKALTAWLGQTKGSVSQTIMTLEKKGFVSRRTDPGDQRVVRLDLTLAGRDMLRTTTPSLVARMLGQLSETERSQFLALTAKMLVGTIGQQGGRPFGACRTCRHFETAVDDGGAHRCRLLDVPLSDDDGRRICFEQVAA